MKVYKNRLTKELFAEIEKLDEILGNDKFLNEYVIECPDDLEISGVKIPKQNSTGFSSIKHVRAFYNEIKALKEKESELDRFVAIAREHKVSFEQIAKAYDNLFLGRRIYNMQVFTKVCSVLNEFHNYPETMSFDFFSENLEVLREKFNNTF